MSKDFKGIEKYLQNWGNDIVNEAKDNASKFSKGGLGKNLKVSVKDDNGTWRITFTMPPYGEYIDKGVSGTEKKQHYIDVDMVNKISPFGYKKAAGHSQPPSSALDKWVVTRGIAPRTKKGRFMPRKSLDFLIARSIGKKGIKSKRWFTEPLALGLKELPIGFAKQFETAVEHLLTKK